MVLVSEPVGGRSRATELPCLIYDIHFDVMIHLEAYFPYFWYHGILWMS